MYRNCIKRILDFTISALALLCLGWFMAIVALWLHFANRGAGALFVQERPGKDEKIFRMYKFKTMTDERDADGNLLPDSQRITTAGRLLRSTSLDELPQLLNVLKGDMSLIGPRPLLVEYLPLYSAEQRRRHCVRPGISGWAQCHGRNSLSWKEKFELDLWYVEHCSIRTDLTVIALTVRNVLRRDGINQKGGAWGTMEPFDGNN